MQVLIQSKWIRRNYTHPIVDNVSAVDIDAIRLEANAEGSTVVAVEASNQALCKMVTLLQYKEQVHPSFTGCTLVGTFQQKGD